MVKMTAIKSDGSTVDIEFKRKPSLKRGPAVQVATPNGPTMISSGQQGAVWELLEAVNPEDLKQLVAFGHFSMYYEDDFLYQLDECYVTADVLHVFFRHCDVACDA